MTPAPVACLALALRVEHRAVDALVDSVEHSARQWARGLTHRAMGLPFGRGEDHPEGLALWSEEDEARQILVIYDSPAKQRLDKKKGTITADLFDLPT